MKKENYLKEKKVFNTKYSPCGFLYIVAAIVIDSSKVTIYLPSEVIWHFLSLVFAIFPPLSKHTLKSQSLCEESAGNVTEWTKKKKLKKKKKKKKKIIT